MRTFFSLFLIYFFSFAKTVIAQSLPDKQEIDNLGRLFIHTINANTPVETEAALPAIFSEALLSEKQPSDLVGFFNRIHNDYSPLKYHHSELLQFKREKGFVFVLHVYAKNPNTVMYQDFQFYAEVSPLFRIRNIAFIAEVSEPISLPNGSIFQEETQKWLDNYILNLHSTYDLSGSILMARGKDIFYEKYFGFEDVERKKPINPKSPFNIASGGKMFTALVIGKLVEDGKIRYEDRITDYIPAYLSIENAEKITIHHLLSHTSGVAEYWWGQTSDEFQKARSIKDHLKIVLKAGLRSPIEKEYYYCNSNYILLGAIIENVTGKSFHKVVDELIFSPIGLNNTGYFRGDSIGVVQSLVRSETDKDWVAKTRGSGKGTSAGGAFSTAREIHDFSIALTRGKIVNSQTLKIMTTRQNRTGEEAEDYGYGFILQNQGEFSFGHGGTAAGVNFEFRYFPSQDITLVVFCNQNNGAYDDLKRNAIKLITGYR